MTFDLDSMLEPVEISKVSEKLNEKQQELRTEGGAALIYNINFIVPIVSKDALEKFKKVINVIGKHYPCRYFLVEILEQAKQLTAEAGVYSFGSENTNRSFSEIVRVKTSVDTLKALPSVLRAQKIEGINTELLLIDAELPVEGLKILLPLVDKLIFDSRIVAPNDKILSEFLAEDFELVDIKWAALSPWREQIREPFERKILQKILSSLKKISITIDSEDRLARAGDLLAGWIISSLGYNLSSIGINGFECQNELGNLLHLKFIKAEKRVASFEGIVSVQLEFETELSQPSLNVAFDGKQLLTSLDLDEELRLQRKVYREDSLLEVLTTVLTIGESMENYRSSLETALELRSLNSRYRGGGSSR